MRVVMFEHEVRTLSCMLLSVLPERRDVLVPIRLVKPTFHI